MSGLIRAEMAPLPEATIAPGHRARGPAAGGVLLRRGLARRSARSRRRVDAAGRSGRGSSARASAGACRRRSSSRSSIDAVEQECAVPGSSSAIRYARRGAGIAFPQSLVTVLGSGTFMFFALILLTATTIGDDFGWAHDPDDAARLEPSRPPARRSPGVHRDDRGGARRRARCCSASCSRSILTALGAQLPPAPAHQSRRAGRPRRRDARGRPRRDRVRARWRRCSSGRAA